MVRYLVTGLVLAMLLPAPSSLNGQSPDPAPTATAADTHPPAATYTTRQNVFAIPFMVDRRVAQPVEVHLYVSVDRGNSWQLYARQPPNTRQFTFRAGGDGEYWFASRTLDANRQPLPTGPPKPEIRVVVDTVPPQLEFTARPNDGGGVMTAWQLFDQNLVPSSLKIEYQEGLGKPWRPVAVKLPRDEVLRTSFQGQMSWWPETRSATINIRAEAQDRAGNRSVINRRLLLPSQMAQNRPDPPTGDAQRLGTLSRLSGPGEGAVPWPSDNPPDASQTPNVPPGLAESVPRQDSSSSSIGHLTSSRGSSNVPSPAATRDQQPDWPGTHHGSLVPPENSAARLGGGDNAGLDNIPQRATEPGQGSPTPTDAAGAPVVGSALPERSRPATHPILPTGEHAEMTNSTRFQLEYDVDAVGPSGVAEVQLWATDDGGQTWRLWGTDDDGTSPMDVAIDEEGIYGFHVVVVSRNGLSGRKPRAGDLADIWVGVDTTPPDARLLSATYGEGADAGKLLVRWDASDAALDLRPITLKFGESPDGPWTIMASALPNSGRYAWTADPHLPPLVYLRLEVRDQAGNVGVHQLKDPIRLDGLAPRARIRGVAPLHDLDREAFRQPRRR